MIDHKNSQQKRLKTALKSSGQHWVGDGFYVHGILRPTAHLNDMISPFILMDYASPKTFTPTKNRRGVGVHPHRGFETVTFAYQGEVEHRDSAGGGGVIKAGDVQWMTAGRGLVHEEFHSSSFSSQGGVFEMVQLWVNLPAKHKMTKPKYQAITSEQIPQFLLKPESSLSLRVIAGEYQGRRGPAESFSAINMFDIESTSAEEFELDLKAGTNTLLLVRNGFINLEGKSYESPVVLVFDREGEGLHLSTSKNFKALLLNAEPIHEPVFAYGPFVMNTREQIVQAIEDYQAGKMGSFD